MYVTFHAKISISDLHLWNLTLIKNVKDTIFFLTRKVSYLWLSPWLLISKKRTSTTFAEKPQMKINSCKKQKHWYKMWTWSDKEFKGTVVNQAMPVLPVGSLLITLTLKIRIDIDSVAWGGRMDWANLLPFLSLEF